MQGEQKNAVDIARVETSLEDHARRLDQLETKVNALEAFQKWALGAGVAVAYFIGLFSDKIRAIFTGKP